MKVISVLGGITIHKYVTYQRLDNCYTGVGNSEDTMLSSNFNDVLTK